MAYPNGVEPEPKERASITIKSYDGMPKEGSIQKLNRLIEQGTFDVHVARKFPLDEAGKALASLKQHFLGKIALLPAN